MELLTNLGGGFEAALAPRLLLFCFIGVTMGTLVGVLPGIGPLVAISVLFPVTFHVPADAALIMLAGIYFGAQYGGSTASILLNLPGTASNAVTCLDGYPMTRAGRGGVALFMTTIASFVGGCTALVILILFTPLIVKVALSFGSPEYFSLMLLGLIAAATLSVASPVKGIGMVVLGVTLGLVGTDVNSGYHRFTFGLPELADGLSLVALAMGLFGVSEILRSLARGETPAPAGRITWRSLVPRRADMRASWMPMARGSVIGALCGILPGAGPSLAAFMAYGAEKRLSPEPERFGKGAIEGIAAPEAANNASVQAAFIPTLSLGIPGDAVMALMLGAIIIHGMIPGPGLIAQNPVLFWSLVASFWIANIMLMVLNLPLIGLWVRMLTVPYSLLYPAVLFFICMGVYSIRYSTIDVFVVLIFGAVGYGMNLVQMPPAPLLLGFILGTPIEEHLRRALIIARGDVTVFVTRPISATLLTLAAFLLVLAHWTMLRRIRQRGQAGAQGAP